jgi:Carboxypeptidase regulatory-like domain/TonB-dependent Receptor Plug Domain
MPGSRIVASRRRRRRTRFESTFVAIASIAVKPLAIALAILTLDHTVAVAQSATATLSGVILDQSKAAVPDVDVVVLNVATRLERPAKTNDRGTFVIPLLPPGHYRLTAQRDGFVPLQVKDVVLNVNDQVTLQLELAVSSVGEAISVVAEPPRVSTSPAVSTVVDRQFVEHLPLNGRSFQSLLALTPGVTFTKANDGTGGQFSVNGQRSNANYFTVDGVGANFGVDRLRLMGGSSGTVPGFSSSGGTNNLVSVDALQEFRIQTSTYAPEFGRQPGGQVQIATRSGTNVVHGTLFDYVRNDAFDASDWFANANNLPKPPLRQHDFGGVIGGPIWLPGLGRGPGYDGRDRTFFFFSYEGLRLRLPQTGVSVVPSLASRAAAPPEIKPWVDAFPLPNGPETGTGLARFAVSYANRSTLNATSLRVDHRIGNAITLFGRYNHAPSRDEQRRLGASLSNVETVPVTTRTLTLGSTQSLTSRMSHDVRVNYATSSGADFNEIDSFGGAVAPTGRGTLPPGIGDADVLLAVFLTTENMGFGLGKNSLNEQRHLNIVDSLALTAGSHQVKAGLDYRRVSPLFTAPQYFPSYFFTDMASMLKGQTSFVQIIAFTPPSRLAIDSLSLYAQDTWAASPRMTLTYGLRWELNPPPASDVDPPLVALAGVGGDPNAIAIAPEGTPLYETRYRNFAPRAGVAYQLRQASGWETMVRGGAGLFYDLGVGASGNAIIGFPYRTDKRIDNVVVPLTAPQAQPVAFPTPPYALPLTSALSGNDPRTTVPVTYQWNATIEQAVGVRQTLTIAYVGAAGRDLLRTERLGTTTNFPVGLTLRRNSASSDYHALQAQFTRRLSRGFQALASYTWGHAIDIGSTDIATMTASERSDPRVDRGSSDYDVRHAASGAITWNLPSPSSRLGSIGTALLRNWSLDTIARGQTATPLTVVSARNIGYGSVQLRPDVVPGVPQWIDDPSVGGGRRLNKAAFVIPTEARQGTLGRNSLRGFPLWQVDLAVRRQINLFARVNLQLRVEAFNLFNHPTFGDPNTTLTSALFGASTQMYGRSLGTGGSDAAFSPLYQVGGPRSMQLAAKIAF